MNTDELAKELDDGRYIDARWVAVEGRWNDRLNTYVGVTEEARVMTLAMVIKANNVGELLVHFEGGPTGFETYRVAHLLENSEFGVEDDDELCICAGSINRWPTVTVNARQVRKFLEEQLKNLRMP
jgi:hypothetical protein